MYNIKNDIDFMYNIANKICEILQIKLPKIIISNQNDKAFMGSPTCKASIEVIVDKNGNEKIKALYLRDEQENKPNFIFTLAHELRHVYQHKKNQITKSNYICRNNNISLENYNNQEQESDAYAFANAILLKKCNIQMNINEMKVSKETQKLIIEKTKKILKTIE